MWDAILVLHLVAMAFFVGGQLMLATVVVPVERANPDRERLRATARRFGQGTLVAIGVLLVTGVAMASHDHRWGSATLQAKLGLVVVVGVLIAWHLRAPSQHVLEGLIFVVSLAIVVLGVVLAN
jgi:putative copper export protein